MIHPRRSLDSFAENTTTERQGRAVSGDAPRSRAPALRRVGATLALAIGAAVGVPATAASAGPLVDPTGFTPAPPATAECREHGGSVLCRTRFTFVLEAVPVLEAPCGTVYENSLMPRDIYTEYIDGLLVGRHVTSHVTGTWSLSPTGAEPSVRIHAGWNWRTALEVPGDESTAQITTHGNQLKLSDGLSRFANISGIFYPDGEYHGQLIDTVFFSPEAQDALCEVLAPS
jgi:hypothetical protein